MKKLILMLLVLAGGVLNVSATTLHIGVEANFASKIIHVYRYGVTDDSWGSEPEATQDGYKYGRLWYHVDMNNNTQAVIRVNNRSGQSVDVTSISGDDYYIYVSATQDGSGKYYAGKLDNPYWSGLLVKNSLDGNWSAYTNNMDNDDDYTSVFSKTWTKAEVDAAKGANNYIWFRFKHIERAFFVEDGTYYGDDWTEFYPAINNTDVPFATPTTSYNHGTSSSNSWQISIPTYNYEKIVITAKYVNESGYKWKISADAYISKTVSGTNQYATLGSTVPLDITELPSGVTAYTLSVTEKGKINKAAKSTTLLANKGVLLHNTSGSDKVLSIPVAASGTADASNDLVGINGGEKLYQPGSDYTYYLLGLQDEHVGFYKVNTTNGNMMGANTAYLKVPNALASAQYLMDFDDETTGINAVESIAETNGEYFNLAGQRVAQPTKGLYIVNGKKVIMK